MSTLFKHYRSGDVFGIRYVFERAGDGLPRHAHRCEEAHNIVVLHGTVVVNIDGEAYPKTLVAGDIFDFAWARPHDVVACTPGAIILNVFLHGRPADYADLPASESEGSYDIRK